MHIKKKVFVFTLYKYVFICIMMLSTLLIEFISLQSLSTGVFIYITFMSLIPEEYHRSQSESQMKISYKVAAFTLGWAILVLLTVATQ